MKARLFLAIVVISAACRKGGNSEAAFANLFKNTEWTGEIKYKQMPIAEPFTVQFQDNSDLVWRERNGTYHGSYTLNPDTREITIQFANNAGKFTTTITSDNKFSNISLGGNYGWLIYGGMLNNAGKKNMDNTKWAAASGTHKFTFKPNQVVQVDSDPEQSYDRVGCAIFDITDGLSNFFIVLQPGNTIKVFETYILPGYTDYWYYECNKQ